MSTQRDRFEALIKLERLSKFLDSHNRPTDIYVENHIRSMWEGFQLGEASGLELAAQKCDETAKAFKGVDKAISAMLKDLADEIRALLAREGE